MASYLHPHGMLRVSPEKLRVHADVLVQAVLMCKKNIDLIRGRVLLQTLPSKAYDTQATLDHAHLYDKEFAKAGIGRDRYCIKIPSTGPALNAAKVLSSEGIPTLGTALFGLPQAIACSQAGMLYISPYFNGEYLLFSIPSASSLTETMAQRLAPTTSSVYGRMSKIRPHSIQ